MSELWIGWTGRIMCSRPGCAGATAIASGMRRDIDGPLHRMGDRERRHLAALLGHDPECETCRAREDVRARRQP